MGSENFYLQLTNLEENVNSSKNFKHKNKSEFLQPPDLFNMEYEIEDANKILDDSEDSLTKDKLEYKEIEDNKIEYKDKEIKDKLYKEIEDNKEVKENNRKRKKIKNIKEDDGFVLNLNDERFSKVYSSHHYLLDPSHPLYKKNKASKIFNEEKRKKLFETEE